MYTRINILKNTGGFARGHFRARWPIFIAGPGLKMHSAHKRERRWTVQLARACGQRERKSRGICSYLFESVMQLSMGRSGARAYACPERAVNTFLVCAHHDLFHPIASITQTLRRARVIDKPPPPPPPPARPRPRRAFDRFPCPHYEYCILWSRVFIRVPIFSFFLFSLPSFTTFPSRTRIMSVFFFRGPF